MHQVFYQGGETLSGPTIKEKKQSFSKKETKVNYILQGNFGLFFKILLFINIFPKFSGSQSWWENPGLVVLVVVCKFKFFYKEK